MTFESSVPAQVRLYESTLGGAHTYACGSDQLTQHVTPIPIRAREARVEHNWLSAMQPLNGQCSDPLVAAVQKARAPWVIITERSQRSSAQHFDRRNGRRVRDTTIFQPGESGRVL